MSLFNFLGEFALVNAVCDLFNAVRDLFASKPKQPVYMPPQRHYVDLDYVDYPSVKTSSSDAAALQSRIDELELLLAETDVMSDSYDEIQDRIDALQERIDCIEEIEDIKDELDYLHNELSDLELERDLYDDLNDDW